MERRIALIRPAASSEATAQALRLVESMLWAFKGTMGTNWVADSTADSADVLVTSVEREEQLHALQRSGKPIVLISAADEPAPSSEYVLEYPFRASQLVQLLNTLDARLAGKGAASQARPAGDAWSFVKSLRTLRDVQNSSVWLHATHARVPYLWLRGDCSEYCVEAQALHDMREGKLQFDAIRLTQGASPPVSKSLRGAVELEWFAGYFGGAELAPWLDGAAAFRITRWPDFGLIRPTPAQIRATALLSAGSLTLLQLAQSAQLSTVEASRVLNALEACGVLTAAGARKATARTAPQVAGGLGSFLRLVRKRLGLGGPQ